MSLRPSFRFRIYSGDTPAIGPGKIALLEAIIEHGSIRAAAKSIGMSYNRAWLLIEEMNKSFKSPVIEAIAGGSKGGGSHVTEVGHVLIQEYRAIESDALKATTKRINAVKALLR